jgi:uncharacterized protein
VLGEGAVVFQRCLTCQHSHALPRTICAACHGRDLAWIRSSGVGRLYTFSVIHRPPDDKWADRVPYAVGLVDLDEGVRIMGQVESNTFADLRCGQAVLGAVRELDTIPIVYFTTT